MSRTVYVQVSDGQSVTVSNGISLTVLNVAPSLTISAPSSAVRGEAITVMLQATDPAAADAAAGFVYKIDWNGDGTVDETVAGPANLAVTHVFASAGNYNVRVTATEKNGGVSNTTQSLVAVAAWQTRIDPHDPTKTNLHWGGTTGIDAYGFFPGGFVFIQAQNNQFFASPQIVSTGNFNGTLYVYGQDSNDLLLADVMPLPLVFYGGNGDDVLVGGRGGDYLDGGNGHDILFGGTQSTDGDDTIFGGTGQDILIGHFGADLLNGGGGQDLLVAGSLYFPENLPASIYAIQAEWQAPRPLAQRVANLSGTGTQPRNNGENFLQPSTTILDDQAIDQVFGDDDADWLILAVDEDITSLDPQDLVTDL